MRRSRLSCRPALLGLLVLGLLAAGCGDDADEGTGATGSTGSTTTSTLVPQKGGSLTVALFSEPRGLDPAASSGSGTAGGTELAALYDSITRWDPQARKYDMRTAESLVANGNSTEWTLKLKSGIRFRDGTAYDAEAVRYNFERNLSTVNVSTSRAWLTYVLGDAKGVSVVDPLTVKFTLKVPYSGFPALLAHSPGNIVSPAKLKALGDPTAADYKAKADAFNLKPEGAGAGPFEIVNWTKGEAIVMKRSPGYHGGDAYLDEVRFITLAGSDKNLDGLKTGTVNVAMLRTPVSVAGATEDKSLGGHTNYIQGGGLLLTNQGVKLTCKDGKPEPLCVGKPDGQTSTTPNTADAKVRMAAALAIDPTVINQRVNAGKGLANNGLFDKNFTLDPGVGGVKPDPAAAKKLLDEAKAAGHSGKIRITCTNQPERVALAQATETMLKAVGFDVAARSDFDTATQIGEITVKRDFDLGCWGFSLPDDDTAILALVQNFWSASPTNRVGYANPAWDAGLNAVMAAKDDVAKKAAYKTLAELWNKDQPSIIFEVTPERIAWQNKVRGVTMNQSSMFFLDKAWIER